MSKELKQLASTLAPHLEYIPSAYEAVAGDLRKWLLASLLAINAGGIIALGQVAKGRFDAFTPSALAFVAGIATAILSAAVASLYYEFTATLLTELVMELRAYEAGVRESVTGKSSCRVNITQWLSIVLAISSLLLFVGGAELGREEYPRIAPPTHLTAPRALISPG